jgi:hypothetical protein
MTREIISNHSDLVPQKGKESLNDLHKTTPVKAALQGAALTVVTLFGGLLLGLALGVIVFHSLPGHSLANPRPVHTAIAAFPALIGFLVGGVAWGVSLTRIRPAPDSRRMALTGLLGFGPITITLAVSLGIVETMAGNSILGQIPIHRMFTLLFVPAAFLIAGVSSWAIGRGYKESALARRLFWQVGLAAAATFLAVNLTMESSGMVVGAPGAAQRATMVTVLISGNICAALGGGGVLGTILAGKNQAYVGQLP